MSVLSLNVYVPRDELFGHRKFADYLFYSLKAVGHVLQAGIKALFDKTPTEFDCLEDTLKLYKHETKLHNATSLVEEKKTGLSMLKEFLRIDKILHLKFPLPHIIKGIPLISKVLCLFVDVFWIVFTSSDHIALICNQRISRRGQVMKNLLGKC